MVRKANAWGKSIHRGSCDGLAPLGQLEAAAELDPAALDPAQVRAVILEEHRKIRALLARLESDAMTLLACSVPKPSARRALQRKALTLCDEMTAHIAFENRVLVPVVEVIDAWGTVRAQTLLDEHEAQLRLLRAYADMLMIDNETNQDTSLTVWQLVRSIGQDMREEERQVLSPEFLGDWVGQNVETG
jgi:iron-sulfur cluster repair protein YtfE (RIC family)